MELYHYGVKGQRWGVRRYQNYDGTRKDLNRKERSYVNKLIANEEKNLHKQTKKLNKNAAKEKSEYERISAKYNRKYANAADEYQKARLRDEYEHKVRKEREEAIAAVYKANNKTKESEYLIESYKHYTPQDVADDKKERAKGLIKVALQFVPVVGTAIDIMEIPSTLNDGVNEKRLNKAYYYDYKKKHGI